MASSPEPPQHPRNDPGRLGEELTRPAGAAPASGYATDTVVDNRYRITGPGRAGGMGVVYPATHLELGETRALKFLHPHLIADGKAIEGFRGEARLAMKLQHSGIVRVFDFGDWGGQKYLAMEWVEGGSLRDHLRERTARARGGRVPLAEAFALMSAVAEALAYAHERQVLHRDLKPENILLENRRPKLTDFGIAKLMSPGELTTTAARMGTAYYMAPEQLQGGVVDPRADIFSFGVVLYELVCGTLPVGRFKLPHERDPSLPAALDALLERCLAPTPEERFGTAAGVQDALREIGRELAEAEEARRRAAEEERRRVEGEHRKAEEAKRRQEEEAARRRAEEEARRREEVRRRVQEEEARKRGEEEVRRRAEEEEVRKREEEAGRRRAAEEAERKRREAEERAAEERKHREEAARREAEEAARRREAEDPRRREEAERRARAEEEKRRAEEAQRQEQERRRRRALAITAALAIMAAVALYLSRGHDQSLTGQEPPAVQPLAPGPQPVLPTPPSAPMQPPAAPAPALPATQPASAPPAPAPHLVAPSPQEAPSASAPPGIAKATDDTEMVLVPAGEFWMGSGAEAKPRHHVYLDAYYIDKLEVTHAQYGRFMQTTGRKAPNYWDSTRYNAANQPVVGVAWDDAEAYCRWAGKRLPTEAEWEKAARGTDERRSPWGNKWDRSRANISESALAKPTAVGTYPDGASPCGAQDMAGNVREWVADWYDSDYYKSSPERNPRGPDSGTEKVLRGGSWDGDLFLLRAAARGSGRPGEHFQNIGFRCARGLP